MDDSSTKLIKHDKKFEANDSVKKLSNQFNIMTPFDQKRESEVSQTFTLRPKSNYKHIV